VLAELKTHLRGAQAVLRSKTPGLVRQEFWGLLLAHFAVRGLMHEAALRADEDPDRLFWHGCTLIGSQGQGCPSNEPWRTAGRSLPMLDAAAKTYTLRCCKVYARYLNV